VHEIQEVSQAGLVEKEQRLVGPPRSQCSAN
jgi:hypothetical protein